jgi:hypothetical protein
MTDVLTWAIVLLGSSAIAGALALYARARGWRVRARNWGREFWTGYRELYERQNLLRRPWEEELLHWSFDGQDWQLHGHLDPPPGRRRSTTRSGWCPATRGQSAADGLRASTSGAGRAGRRMQTD